MRKRERREAMDTLHSRKVKVPEETETEVRKVPGRDNFLLMKRVGHTS
jgi:hypothetical protein